MNVCGFFGVFFKSQVSSLIAKQEFLCPSPHTLGSSLGHLCRNLDPAASVGLILFVLYCKVHTLDLSSGSKVHGSHRIGHELIIV